MLKFKDVYFLILTTLYAARRLMKWILYVRFDNINNEVIFLEKYKKQVLLILLSLQMVSTCATASGASSESFSDISNSFWGYPHIQWALDNEVIEGYPNGTFQPNSNVDQYEFIAMLIRAYHPADFVPSPESSNWATPYATYANNMNWKTVAPSSLGGHATTHMSMSRGMVAQMLANATGRNYSREDSIRYVLDTGLAEGKTELSVDGFHSGDFVTRTEAVTFIERMKVKFDHLQANPPKEEHYQPITTMLYENDTYHFSLQLPLSWADKYDIVDQAVSYGHSINFINKATGTGILFTLAVWDKEEWNLSKEEIKGIIPISEIGEKGNQVFLFFTPTDVQYDPSDEKGMVDYLAMFQSVKMIKPTFKIINE
ncbi:S-layer homology domain-containing protein [Paenibacillus alba]|uniref:S-layer homology domain-containing protein n=1 Tax=Paenibacillus alba TaxID=1197127 RepID=A0ABU6G0V0_9BACL|nr:S-layer homology domain-containing protein [Paenibacillus alba]MEC0227185.1 S-layer homology domain-containing protein [Paenibacillus alba]